MAQLLSSLDSFPETLRGGAVAVGNFDGVHRGHAVLVSKLVESARAVGGPAIVLTFDPPPVAVLVPDRPPVAPLTSIRRRADLLGHLGVDALVAYPTDRALLSLTAEDFFREKILLSMHARAMVEGPNFQFGKDRGGDTGLLNELCESAGIALNIIEANVDSTGEMISSTRIRGLLADGKIEAANSLLTQPYEISGIVSKGAQRGREIGFPTANLASVECLLPGSGVYSGSAQIDGGNYCAAINIGPNPTFGEKQDKVEIHVIGWSGTIYGEKLTCRLLRKIRDVQQFASVDELRRQLESDIDACRN